MKYVVTIPEIVLLVVTIVTLALFVSIYPIKVLWKPVFANPDTQAFYPSDYNLSGSTKLVSGTLTNLQSDDNGYMTFRSYVSATSTTTKTEAFIAYRSNTLSGLNFPKNRTWDGDAAVWGGENEMDTAGSPVRSVRTAICPKGERALEKIVVTLSDDGYLDAYVFDGTSWNVTNDIGQVWTSAPTDGRRPYDVIYEQSSGEALLVYGTTVAGGGNDIAYRTWSFVSGWGSEQYYDDSGHASKITVTYVVLASDKNSDKIGMTYIDSTNSDANAVIWDGSTWGNFIEITGTVAIATEECIAIESECLSGAFMAVAGEGQFIRWARFTTSWSSLGIFDINSGATTAMNWLKLAQSQGNRLMLTSVDGATDLCTAVWDEGLYGNRQWSTASSSIGSMTATTSVTAMRFTAQASKSVTNILVYIQTVLASPAYRFGIETSATTYLPSGTYVGGASNYAVYTPTATGWLNLTLPLVATLTAGTVYHVTVRYDSGTIGTSNYIALRRMGTLKNDFRVSENKIDSWLNVIFGTTIQNYEPVFVLRYNDATYESMPYDTVTTHNIFGVNWFSEKWTQSGTQITTGVNIPLVKIGTPLDSLYVVLRNETDLQDVATITISQSEITTTLQWYEKYFSSLVSLINGKTYRLILKSPSSTLATNCFTCRSLLTGQSGSLTYDGTNSVYSASTNSGSSWTDTTTRDLIYIILNGSTLGGFVIHVPHDTTVDSNAQRCADFAWEYRASPEFRNQGLLVYGTTTGVITWRRFRVPNYITAVTSPAMVGGIHPWVQLKSNPRTVSGDVKILGVVLTDTVYDIGAIRWDGTTFTIIGTNTISSDTTVITYECFEMEFNMFGDPTDFISEVEFTGTSNTEPWTQLVWTIDSSFTTEGVTATFQLYNYQTGQYPTSGDGYMTATIGTTDVTKTQTITTNPTNFRDGSGNWKINVTGVKTTPTQFDWNGDLVKIEVTGIVLACKLNLKVMDWDLTDAIPNTYVTMNNGTDNIQVSDSNGWANYTGVSGTVTVKVQYFGFWVNGTFSVTMDSDKTIDVQCKLYDVTVLVQEGVQNAYLAGANVTVYNSTSVQGNKITSGVTGNNGQVQLLNLPNNTLTFTQYGGASYSLVIGNTTQLVSLENQTITLTADQNNVNTNNNYSIIAFVGMTIPFKSSFVTKRLKKKMQKRSETNEGSPEEVLS